MPRDVRAKMPCGCTQKSVGAVSPAGGGSSYTICTPSKYLMKPVLTKALMCCLSEPSTSTPAPKHASGAYASAARAASIFHHSHPRGRLSRNAKLVRRSTGESIDASQVHTKRSTQEVPASSSLPANLSRVTPAISASR